MSLKDYKNNILNKKLDIIFEEHKLYIETYRHHFDLLAKATLIYFTATGAVGSFIVNSETDYQSKIFLTLLVIF